MVHFYIFVSSITGCTSIFAFASLLGISIGIMSPVIGLEICAIARGIEKYKPIIKKNKRSKTKYYC